MKKCKENMFAKKFRLLSSQGSSEDINWSSSDSSEYENISSNTDKQCKLSYRTRKRKRKQKVPKNMSNLNITIIDTNKDDKGELNTNKKTFKKEGSKSPILCNLQYSPPYKLKELPTSPILSSRALDLQPKSNKSVKSPIIVLKTASPISSLNVRKKLFDITHKDEIYTHRLQNRCKSNNHCLDRRKSNNNEVDTFRSLNDVKIEKLEEKSPFKYHDQLDNIKVKLECKAIEENMNYTIQETPEDINFNDSIAMLKTSSKDLASKVKSYFENHFSSENVSQQSISDISTPKNNSKTSDDIEIISTITQVASNRNSSESIPEIVEINKKDKKIKYKKDGLANRLNSLLKKQTASISLWQHERFLAANSDFVIPKGEFKAFRICKIDFGYGVYLLDAMDLNDENFLILINKGYVSHDRLVEDAILKLYEPYKIMDFVTNNSKLILNVCKFECVQA